jgi:hypothetical protein
MGPSCAELHPLPVDLSAVENERYGYVCDGIALRVGHPARNAGALRLRSVCAQDEK